MLKYFALLFAYFLGAIPFAYLAGRIKHVDIRSQGSGNIGSTNAFRLLGAKYGLAVFAGDALKGILATALCLSLWGPWGGLGGGILAIIGHGWNPFFKFKPTRQGCCNRLWRHYSSSPLDLFNSDCCFCDSLIIDSVCFSCVYFRCCDSGANDALFIGASCL